MPYRKVDPSQIPELTDNETTYEQVSLPQLTGQEEQAGPIEGALDAASAIATGMVATPISGLAGIGQMVYNAVHQGPEMSPTERIHWVQRAFTDEPDTKTGREYLYYASLPSRYYGKAVDYLADETYDATGSPLLATAVGTTATFAPALIHAKMPKSLLAEVKTRHADRQSIKNAADELGVKLEAAPEKQTAALVNTAEDRAAVHHGDDFDTLANRVGALRKQEKQQVSANYEQAKEMTAAVDKHIAQSFGQRMYEAIDEEYDVDAHSALKSLFKGLSKKVTEGDSPGVSIKRLQQWRKTLSSRNPGHTDPTAARAVKEMKTYFDDFMQAMFTHDMIHGEADAIHKWQVAIKSNAQFKQRFDNDKFIGKIANEQMTVDQVREWIFGASAVGAKKVAAQTVDKLKKLVGKNSPEFTALKKDAMLDIFEPLLDEKPNLQGYIRRYDKFIKKNQALADTLFDADELKRMQHMRDIAAGVVNSNRKRKVVEIQDDAMRVLAGNRLQQGTAHFNVARFFLDRLKHAAGKSEKRQIISGALGYDPYQLMIPGDRSLLAGSIANMTGNEVITGVQQPQDEQPAEIDFSTLWQE